MYLAERKRKGNHDLSAVCIQLHWSLSLSDHLIVALEDASLIQMNAVISGSDVTVQGRREEVLSSVEVSHLTPHAPI